MSTACLAVGGDVGAKAERVEDGQRHLLVDRVVLGEQHAARTPARGVLGARLRGDGRALAEQPADAVEQLGLPHRLGEERADAGSAAAARSPASSLELRTARRTPRSASSARTSCARRSPSVPGMWRRARPVVRPALRGGLLQQAQRAVRVGGARRLDRPGAEVLVEHGAVGRVVVHDERAHVVEPLPARRRGSRCAGGSGTSNQNVEPTPGVLSTSMLPSSSSTSWRLMVRPRPVPP
jgi:hypothetical protein